MRHSFGWIDPSFVIKPHLFFLNNLLGAMISSSVHCSLLVYCETVTRGTRHRRSLAFISLRCVPFSHLIALHHCFQVGINNTTTIPEACNYHLTYRVTPQPILISSDKKALIYAYIHLETHQTRGKLTNSDIIQRYICMQKLFTSGVSKQQIYSFIYNSCFGVSSLAKLITIISGTTHKQINKNRYTAQSKLRPFPVPFSNYIKNNILILSVR